MPTMPFNITRRAKRLSEQRWLLDAIISLMGPDWDQGRLGYMSSTCGHDSQGDFIGLRQRIKTYNDMTREFMQAARRRELRAEAELKLGHDSTARESFFTASIHSLWWSAVVDRGKHTSESRSESEEDGLLCQVHPARGSAHRAHRCAV